MSDNKTLFVIGAGASASLDIREAHGYYLYNFKFSLGTELVNAIANYRIKAMNELVVIFLNYIFTGKFEYNEELLVGINLLYDEILRKKEFKRDKKERILKYEYYIKEFLEENIFNKDEKEIFKTNGFQAHLNILKQYLELAKQSEGETLARDENEITTIILLKIMHIYQLSNMELNEYNSIKYSIQLILGFTEKEININIHRRKEDCIYRKIKQRFLDFKREVILFHSKINKRAIPQNTYEADFLPEDKEKAENILKHFKNIVWASTLIHLYKPYSIDYFMQNIDSFAENEFEKIHISHPEYTSHITKMFTHSEEIEEHRKQEQHKIKIEIKRYAKLIMNFIFSESHKTNEEVDEENYIKKLSWKIMQDSYFHNKVPKEYFKESIKIINFNYDNTLETIMPKYTNIAEEDITGNMFKVYGTIRPHNKIDSTIIGLKQFLDFKTEQEREGVLVLIDLLIRWIGEDGETNEKAEERRKKYREEFLKADEIYFLGFGFDFYNLYQLGLINKDKGLHEDVLKKAQKTNIIVASGRERELKIIKDLLNIKEYQKIENSYIAESKKYKIQILTEYLPKALNCI